MHQPIQLSARVQLVDALRGFCLLGIILANVPVPEQSSYFFWNTTSIHSTAQALMHILLSTKFITIFSILFGFGFAIQLKRAAADNVHFRRYFFTRMLLLLLIGCLHAYLLWFGDIIRYYAICGMFLLLVHQLSTKRILQLSLLFIIFLTALVFILNGALELQQYSYDYSIPQKIFSVESYRQYLLFNFTIDPMVNFVEDSPITFVSCFGKILFGYWLGRTGFFNKMPSKQRFNWWFYSGLLAGFGASILFWMINKGLIELDIALLWLPFLVASGLFLHSLFYMAVFIRIYSKKWGQRLLSFFAPMGRMALSSYLMQTVFYLFLFYQWTGGLQLYGKLSTVETYTLALFIFLIQALCCHWWMRRHAQGPVEFLWKRMSYRLVRYNKSDIQERVRQNVLTGKETAI